MKNKSRGFIGALFMIIALVIILILLRYGYDLDILDRLYKFGVETWVKYGDIPRTVWNWILDRFR